MEAPELARTTVASGASRLSLAVTDTAAIAAGLFALTLAGALLDRVWPPLAAVSAPHPALRPTFAAIAAILVTNLRVLALPFILASCRFATTLPARLLGDGLVVGVLGANAISVGVALGRWQARLVPYVPHLPFEYLAAATAAGVWLHARREHASQPRVTAGYAAVTVLLLTGAAVVEVLLTPHAR